MIKNNFKVIYNYSIKIGGAIFAFLGFVSVFIDISSCFPRWSNAILCILCILVFVVLMACIYVLTIRKKEVFLSKNQKSLTVSYGDLFEDNSKIKVIAVNRCFDTEVNGELISPQSLHGKWIQQHLKNISVSDLNNQINESLKNQGCKGEFIQDKHKGSQIRYPLGTIAEIYDGEIRYYLLALTEMDSNLNSHCTLEDYCYSISKLMHYYDMHGQGNNMVIPIIGSGFARLDRSEKELLDLMISLIKIHQTDMRGNIKIIVHNKLRSLVPIADL